MSSYTPVGWANDETHPLSQANMKTLDQGLKDVPVVDLGTVTTSSTQGITLTFDAGVYRSVTFEGSGSGSDGGNMRARVGAGTLYTDSNYRSTARWWDSGTNDDRAGGELQLWVAGHTRTSTTTIRGSLDLLARSFESSGHASNGPGASANFSFVASGYLTADPGALDRIQLLAPPGSTWVAFTLRAWGHK